MRWLVADCAGYRLQNAIAGLGNEARGFLEGLSRVITISLQTCSKSFEIVMNRS